jgi:multidrug resistance efflux pump
MDVSGTGYRSTTTYTAGPVGNGNGNGNGTGNGTGNGYGDPSVLQSGQVLVQEEEPLPEWSLPDGYTLPKHGPRHGVYRRYRIGRYWSWMQVVAGVLLAGVLAAGVVWYVPRVIRDDHEMFTGSVATSGIVILNFPSSGIISSVRVQLNQPVHRGQVLAAEYAPTAGLLIKADNEEISAVQAKIAVLKYDEAENPLQAPSDNAQIAAEDAQMAEDNVQLANDRMKMAATEIVAPAAGVIVAANGEPGEAVTSSGIRDYSSTSQGVSAQEQPQFSLLPEGPQAVGHNAAAGTSLPVIAMRVSFTWQVVALVPEDLVQSVKAGQAVAVSVPAARIKNVPGQVQEVLPNPTISSTGTLYQAIIAINSNVTNPPLDGMAADIQLSSGPPPAQAPPSQPTRVGLRYNSV